MNNLLQRLRLINNEAADYIEMFEAKLNEKVITRISTNSEGRIFAVYLRDGTKIVIGREPGKTKGPAWLEIVPQEVIKLQET